MNIRQVNFYPILSADLVGTFSEFYSLSTMNRIPADEQNLFPCPCSLSTKKAVIGPFDSRIQAILIKLVLSSNQPIGSLDMPPRLLTILN